MGLFGWLRKGADDGGEVKAWREQWTLAVASRDPVAFERLAADLQRQPPMADDLEVEQEMLDGLRQLIDLERDLAALRLPIIDTTHRVVGADRCHFSAPVSMPDDPAQPTGRLLLTSTRAVFAGGARTPALPWHATREIVQSGRDLIFVFKRAGEDDGFRFRCNSFADALCAAAIGRHLMRQPRGAQL
jgi:hypothetical protein